MKCKFHGKMNRVCDSCGLKNDCVEFGCQICGSPISKDERFLSIRGGGICGSCVSNADSEVLRASLLFLIDVEYEIQVDFD